MSQDDTADDSIEENQKTCTCTWQNHKEEYPDKLGMEKSGSIPEKMDPVDL